MAAATLGLTIEQGSTFTRKLTFKDSGNTPIDVTGRTFAGKIRKSIGGAVVATFDFEMLDQVTNTGEVYLKLSASASDAIQVPKQDTADRASVEFVYDIEQVLIGGAVERILQGKVTLSPSVTK